MWPSLFTDDALVEVTVATLSICWHLPRLVTALTVSVFEVFAAMSPSVHCSVCTPATTFTAHNCGLVTGVVQVTPPPEGSGSLFVTAFAVPGPLLVTTMVNVAVSPAVIKPPVSPGTSGLFTIASTGVPQVMLAPLLTEATFDPLAVAVLVIAAQCPRLVAPVTTAVKVAPSLKLTPRLQSNVCAPTDPVIVQPVVV